MNIDFVPFTPSSFFATYSISWAILSTLKVVIFVASRPWSQKVHKNGHPLAVSKAGLKVPSKNLSNRPVVYGEGITSLPSVFTEPNIPILGM